MPLLHDGLAIQLAHEAVVLEHGRVQAETHGPAHVPFAGHHVFLVGHRGDDREPGLRVKFCAVGTRHPSQVAGYLDSHAMQAEAETEHWDAVLAGMPHRADLAFNSAHAEAAGYEHAIDVGEVACGTLGRLAVIARHPPYVDADVVSES